MRGKKREQKICQTCGKLYQPGHAKQKYCSYACTGKAHSVAHRGERATRWQGGDLTIHCEICGQEVKRPRNQVERSEHFFCSVKCRGIWMSKNRIRDHHPNWNGEYIEVRCASCGNSITLPRWHAKRKTLFFCDYQCSADWKSMNRAGEFSHLWKGGRLCYYGPNWSRQKAKARKRDGYCCQQCGKQEKKTSPALHVHHVVPFRMFGYIPGQNENYQQANDLSNLITLCHSCHHEADAEYRNSI